ncbi:DUF4493 domain-containing protein [uncultured Parabacteroides sp.]|uniref:DUF4493 domain-containing protein n=1 Tax=uncultured Parabacteroides sp. TaxID=512312 RepID=UPI002611078A|nr:DUF4493 domain-containing protein [uncultured Parabacteroides sp.]
MSMVKPITYWALCCLLFFVSCEMKKDLFGQGQGNEEEGVPENVGLLDLHVVAEREAAVPGTKGDPEEDLYLATDDFCVSILDSVGQVVKSYDSYAALKADGELLLPAGKYTVRAFSGDDPDAGFDAPYYEGDTTCVVSAKEVVKIETNCRLSNKKVQFDLSDRFFDSFRSDYTIVVDNGTGVLTISSDELRSAYFRNTGTLRFTIYTTTYKGESYTYSCDLSKDEQIKEHNNLYIKLDAIDARPDEPGEPSDPGNPDNPGPGEPSEPDEPEGPTDPEKPEYPSSAPTIKVDVSLVEKNYIIEVPSDFVEVDKPDKPSTPGGNEPGEGETPAKTEPEITGEIDGKLFDVGSPQTITGNTKNIIVYLYLPTGLDALTVDVVIGDLIELKSMNLLDPSALASINQLLFDIDPDLKLEVPNRGEKGKLKFDISSFKKLLESNNSFNITIKDKNGKECNEKIILNKK